MNKLQKNLRQLHDLNKLKSGSHNLSAHVLEEQDARLNDAKRLHTLMYLDLGFIREQDVDNRGVLKKSIDPHQTHATYFCVTADNNRSGVLGVARHINAKPGLGFDSFPILQKAKIEKSFKAKLTENYQPGEVVEVSALAKTPGASSIVPLLLFKKMLDHSLANKHKIWIMALEEKVYTKVSYNFGSVIHPVGRITRYRGGNVIPLVAHVDQVFHVLRDQAENSKLMQRRARKILHAFFISDLSAELEVGSKK